MTDDNVCSSSSNKDHDDTENNSIVDNLITSETLDRSSPELWPESGCSYAYVQQDLFDKSGDKPWILKPSNKEDKKMLKDYEKMSYKRLVSEVKVLVDHSYKLGCREAGEMTRAKYLGFLDKEDD